MQLLNLGSTTVYVIGRCPQKGCKNRRRNTRPGVIKEDRFGVHTVWKIPAAQPYGEIEPRCQQALLCPVVSRFKTDDTWERVWLAAIKAMGWVCETHDRFMTLTEVKGTVNVDKTCDGRCMGAVGPACDCPCGGANHGAAYELAAR